MMGELVVVGCHKVGKAECSGRKGIGMWKTRGNQGGMGTMEGRGGEESETESPGNRECGGLGEWEPGNGEKGWRSQLWCCWGCGDWVGDLGYLEVEKTEDSGKGMGSGCSKEQEGSGGSGKGRFQGGRYLGPSTENAFAIVSNDLSLSKAQNQCSILILLDPPVAFNTTDHGRLLDILSASWFSSYLCNHFFSVSLGRSLSPPLHSSVGVLQGSVLGHFLCTLSLGNLTPRHKFSYCPYADESQIYRSTPDLSPSVQTEIPASL
ncbi:hypothetical protein KIL84_014069 [Mauremys mutica]|uniref:Uncharacterized protein n=1 Tax=Mauremys mutica TaxID=74926 RepID=A0A9D3WLN4_9SAUR|nr:hypothetical protein KIL84_014069 [Mauremys mutica]